MQRLFRLALPLGIAACTSGASGTLQIVLPPDEPATLTEDPAVTHLEVDGVEPDASAPTSLGSASLPTATIDLGGLDPTLTTIVTVTGFDATGDRVVFGETVDFTLGDLEGITVPVFVQRTGEMAEMPTPPSDDRPSPLLGIVGGRYLFIGGGTDSTVAKTMQLYDFVQLAPVSSLPTLPTAPLSAAFNVSQTDNSPVGWFVDATSTLYQLDFSQTAATVVQAPAGDALGNVAGGAAVFDSDTGDEYLVGATRSTGSATASVLVIGASGTLSWASPGLLAQRLGAATTWVPGLGLFVAGGCVDPSCVGAEILTGGNGRLALNYPFDATTGSGAALLQGQSVILAGGVTSAGIDAGVRVLDANCTTAAACSPTVWTSLPVTLVNAQVFTNPTDATHVLVTGNEADGTFHVYRVGMSDGVDVLQTRVGHHNAGAIFSPLGSVIVFGGANDLESFTP